MLKNIIKLGLTLSLATTTIAGIPTWSNEPVVQASIKNIEIKHGSKGSSVKELQKDLKRHGYIITADGIFGDKTKNAVEKFQKSYKLTPTGVVDTKTWTKLKEKPTVKVNTEKYKPMYIYFAGKSVPYKNGGQEKGQSIIDKTNYASTWGGASFSGTDKLNTHFIGHNGGKNQFKDMHTSDEFIVTDADGNAFKYVKDKLYVVDEYGVRTDNGQDMWDRIVGTGGGERIVLQSTKNHPLKWIVEAKFVEQVQ